MTGAHMYRTRENFVVKQSTQTGWVITEIIAGLSIDLITEIVLEHTWLD